MKMALKFCLCPKPDMPALHQECIWRNRYWKVICKWKMDWKSHLIGTCKLSLRTMWLTGSSSKNKWMSHFLYKSNLLRNLTLQMPFLASGDWCFMINCFATSTDTLLFLSMPKWRYVFNKLQRRHLSLPLWRRLYWNILWKR